MIYKVSAQLVLAVMLALNLEYNVDLTLLNISYIIAYGLFTVGIFTTINFTPKEVQNPSYIKEIRHSINKTRTSFLVQFVIMSASLLIFCDSNHWNVIHWIKDFNPTLFTQAIILFSIFFFLIDLKSILKLKSDLNKRIKKEKSN